MPEDLSVTETECASSLDQGCFSPCGEHAIGDCAQDERCQGFQRGAGALFSEVFAEVSSVSLVVPGAE